MIQYQARIHRDIDGQWFGQLWAGNAYISGSTCHADTKEEVLAKLRAFKAWHEAGEAGEEVIAL